MLIELSDWVACPTCKKRLSKLKYGNGEFKCSRCKTLFNLVRSESGIDSVKILSTQH